MDPEDRDLKGGNLTPAVEILPHGFDRPVDEC